MKRASMQPPREKLHPLPAETLEAIRQFDTCTIANAIEQFGVRLRNEGYTHPGLRCMTGDFPRLLGYAATCTIRSSETPMTGQPYFDRTDWWGPIERLPIPRIAVIENLDEDTGSGAAVGEVHAAVLKAFHCGGLITNGAVRDIPGLSRMQFPVFAHSITVSHAYTHLVNYGNPVEIFGLAIRSGDLLYADCHGVISIPLEIASELPEAAASIRANERRIIEVCESPDFTPEKLLQVIKHTR